MFNIARKFKGYSDEQIAEAMTKVEETLIKKGVISRLVHGQEGNIMRKTLISMLAVIFLIALAPTAAGMVATWAASTPTPNATTVSILTLVAWIVPLGLAGAVVLYAIGGMGGKD